MTDKELNHLVADKVMGWATHCRNTVHWTLKEKANDVGYPVLSETGVWAPAFKIEDAWMVVEKMRADEYILIIEDRQSMNSSDDYKSIWNVIFRGGNVEYTAEDKYICRAICLAALHAVEESK